MPTLDCLSDLPLLGNEEPEAPPHNLIWGPSARLGGTHRGAGCVPQLRSAAETRQRGAEPEESEVQVGRSGRRRGRGPEVVEAVADGRVIPHRLLGRDQFSLQDSSSCVRRRFSCFLVRLET